jgi:hypothetical protein
LSGNTKSGLPETKSRKNRSVFWVFYFKDGLWQVFSIPTNKYDMKKSRHCLPTAW